MELSLPPPALPSDDEDDGGSDFPIILVASGGAAGVLVVVILLVIVCVCCCCCCSCSVDKDGGGAPLERGPSIRISRRGRTLDPAEEFRHTHTTDGRLLTTDLSCVTIQNFSSPKFVLFTKLLVRETNSFTLLYT